MKDFRNPSKPCHVGIHWKALAEYSQINARFSAISVYLNDFVLIKSVTSSIKVKISYTPMLPYTTNTDALIRLIIHSMIEWI